MKKLILGCVAFSAWIAPAFSTELPRPIQETVIYNFTGSDGDGIQPVGPLIAATSSSKIMALYGVTAGGGANGGACAQIGGCGTVFKLERPERGETAWT
jgi:hypothetical protein